MPGLGYPGGFYIAGEGSPLAPPAPETHVQNATLAEFIMVGTRAHARAHKTSGHIVTGFSHSRIFRHHTSVRAIPRSTRTRARPDKKRAAIVTADTKVRLKGET